MRIVIRTEVLQLSQVKYIQQIKNTFKYQQLFQNCTGWLSDIVSFQDNRTLLFLVQ